MAAESRSDPRPWRADYVQLRALSLQIAARAESHFRTANGIALLDVGCGDRPYETALQSYTTQYVGLDSRASEGVDVVGDAGYLPFPDNSFDCVLCTQVLQYVDDPDLSVQEMRRVLRPGGILFLSTHGVAFEDRDGLDRWRWTRVGLRVLLEGAGQWRTIDVMPAGGVICAANYLLTGQIEAAAHRVGLPWLAFPFCFALNAMSWNADRLTRRLFPALPPEVAVNYLAVACAA